jgi:hypothetical protein
MTYGVRPQSEDERWEWAVASLREYLRDKKGLGRIWEDGEHSDGELRMALMFAIDDWNNTPPPIGKVDLAKHPAKSLLIICAAAHAIESALAWHMREHMPVSDGDVMVDDHDKLSSYLPFLQRLQDQYETKKSDYKVMRNLQGGNDSAPSEYSFYFKSRWVAW